MSGPQCGIGAAPPPAAHPLGLPRGGDWRKMGGGFRILDFRIWIGRPALPEGFSGRDPYSQIRNHRPETRPAPRFAARPVSSFLGQIPLIGLVTAAAGRGWFAAAAGRMSAAAAEVFAAGAEGVEKVVQGAGTAAGVAAVATRIARRLAAGLRLGAGITTLGFVAARDAAFFRFAARLLLAAAAAVAATAAVGWASVIAGIGLAGVAGLLILLFVKKLRFGLVAGERPEDGAKGQRHNQHATGHGTTPFLRYDSRGCFSASSIG
jgi:hypothetical protein